MVHSTGMGPRLIPKVALFWRFFNGHQHPWVTWSHGLQPPPVGRVSLSICAGIGPQLTPISLLSSLVLPVPRRTRMTPTTRPVAAGRGSLPSCASLFQRVQSQIADDCGAFYCPAHPGVPMAMRSLRGRNFIQSARDVNRNVNRLGDIWRPLTTQLFFLWSAVGGMKPK